MDGADYGELLLRSLIGQLDVRWATSPHGGMLMVVAPAVRPVTVLSQCVPLEDTDRPPYVPLDRP